MQQHSTKLECVAKELKEARERLDDTQKKHANLEALYEVQRTENRAKSDIIIELKTVRAC